MAERLRSTLASREIRTPSGTIHATASFGVASDRPVWPAEGASADQLLAYADLCLYASKRAGRNCVTGQEALPASQQDAASRTASA